MQLKPDGHAVGATPQAGSPLAAQAFNERQVRATMLREGGQSMSRQCQYVFPPFRLDPLDATLWRDGERVPLPAKNFTLLSYLVMHAGRLVAHDEILDAVWAHRFVSPSVLKGAVARLRAALEDDAKHCRFIQTVNQRGYRFVANVDVCSHGESWLQPKAGDVVTDARPVNWVRREGPCRELERVLHASPDAGPRIVVLTGEAGSGKSTLIEMLLRHPELAGTRVLSGRCAGQFGPDREFHPLICALEDACRALGSDATRMQFRKDLLNAAASNLAVPNTPDSGRASIGIAPSWADLTLGDWCALIEALCREQPLMIVIDDMQWCDTATMNLLALLSSRPSPMRLVLIGAYRPIDAALDGHPVRQLHDQWRVREGVQTIRLAGMTLAEVRAYAQMRLGVRQLDEVRTAQIHLRTRGNPLAVAAMIARAEAPSHHSAPHDEAVPQALRHIIEHQHRRLDSLQLSLLRAATGAGEQWSAALVAAGANCRLADAERSLRALAGLRILERIGLETWPDGTQSSCYAFAERLHADLLYDELSPAERAELYGRMQCRLASAYRDVAHALTDEASEKPRQPGANFIAATPAISVAQ